MRTTLTFLGLLVALAVGCKSQDNTKIVVAVWSDLAAPAEIDKIRVDVTGPTDGTTRLFALSTGSASDTTRVQYELVPLAAKNVTFTVRATALRGPAEIVSQTARVSFVPGQALLLKLFLGRTCEGVMCAGDTTCFGGTCGRPIPVASLEPYDPSRPLRMPDTIVTGVLDAGVETGGAVDAAADSQTVVPNPRLSDAAILKMDIGAGDAPMSAVGGNGPGGYPGTGGALGTGGAVGTGGTTVRAGDASQDIPTMVDVRPNSDSPGSGGISGVGDALLDADPTGTGSGGVVWTDVNLGLASANSLGRVAVGNGRNDGQLRVYAGESSTSAGNVYEFSYSTSGWSKAVALPGVHLSTVAGLKIGDLRAGTSAVYANGYGFAEMKYAQATWSVTEPDVKVTNGIQWTNALFIGAGRDDGRPRAYVADWDRIIEVSFDFGDWTGFEIDTSGQPANDVIVADGRNEGHTYLYATLGTFGGPVWELAWNASTSQYEIASNPAPSGRYMLLCAGAGRNDGVQRVYAWGSNGLSELSYASGAWTMVTISSAELSSQSMSGMATGATLLLADGRNDGITRLYTADGKGVGEYTFAGSWRKSSLITDIAATGIDVGKGRNDGVNRLYVTQGYNLHEYTAVAAFKGGGV